MAELPTGRETPMYGRCETDPFDQAVDVCGSCFGEFCANCLVTTKGRKHPICTECAIIASGVRPGTKPLIRGSKKTAKARRRALREAPRTPAQFDYYGGPDEDRTPSPTDVEAKVGPEPESGARSERGLPPLPPLGPSAAATGESVDLDRPRSAIEQLEEMGREPSPEPGPTTGRPPVPISHPVAPVDEFDEIPDLSKNPFATPPLASTPPTARQPTRGEPATAQPAASRPSPEPALQPILPDREATSPLPRRRSTITGPAADPPPDGRCPEQPDRSPIAAADPPRRPLPRRRSAMRTPEA